MIELAGEVQGWATPDLLDSYQRTVIRWEFCAASQTERNRVDTSTDLVQAIVGSLILTTGLRALAFAAVRRWDRTLQWFGLLMGTLERLSQALVVYMAMAIAYAIAGGRSDAAMWTNPPAIIIAFVIGLIHVLVYGRRLASAPAWIAISGGVAFSTVVLPRTSSCSVN